MYNFILSFIISFFGFFAFSEKPKKEAGQLLALLVSMIILWEILPGVFLPLSSFCFLLYKRIDEDDPEYSYVKGWGYSFLVLSLMYHGCQPQRVPLNLPGKTIQESFEFNDYLLSKQELLTHYKSNWKVTRGLNLERNLKADILEHPARKYLLENPAVCVLHVGELSSLDFATYRTNSLLLSVPQAFYSNRRFTCRIAIVYGHGDSKGGIHGHLTHALNGEPTRFTEEELRLAYPQLELMFVKCRGGRSYDYSYPLYAQDGSFFTAEEGQSTYGDWFFEAWKRRALKQFFDLYRYEE